MCHMTISDENIVEWLLNPFSGRGGDSASSGDPLSPVTSAQTSPCWKDDSKRRSFPDI